jgi:hypothetical protein
VTREEFIAQHAEAESLSVEQWNELYDVYPCVSDDPMNEGWQMTEKGKDPILPTGE